MLNHARNWKWTLVPKPPELHLDHQSWANVRRLLLRPISYRFESVCALRNVEAMRFYLIVPRELQSDQFIKVGMIE
jgi:hypothetical protein